MQNSSDFDSACAAHLRELLGTVPPEKLEMASMQLKDTASKFTRWTAGRLAVSALERAEGTCCATECPVLKSFIHDCYDLVEQTQAVPGRTN